MKQRIWELDVFRGICILGMVAVHFVYDLVELYGLVSWQYPPVFTFVKQWGGVLFLLLSGICATLGSRSVRRGLIVFLCGMLCSAVTFGMYRLGMSDKSILIYFGVLHCLGVCMILWPLFRKMPWWLLGLLGIVLTALGFYLGSLSRPDWPWLMPLGLPWKGFATSDYFPLLPNLGFFLLGAAVGRTVYRRQVSLLPGVRADRGVLRFLGFCGRQSLPIYLLHQPLLSGILYLVMLLK